MSLCHCNGKVIAKPLALTIFPFNTVAAFIMKQFPGPNENGLGFLREKTEENPRYSAVWRGPLAPTFSLVLWIFKEKTKRIKLLAQLELNSQPLGWKSDALTTVPPV